MKSKGKIAGVLTTLVIALAIFSVSLFKSSNPKIVYSQTILSEKVESSEQSSLLRSKSKTIDYQLAYPGKIHPDSPLWYAKVVRDKIWYFFAFNKDKKAELNLLFADKRLNSALVLFERNKPDLGLSTLTKAEKYLEMAIPSNADKPEYLNKLALASLKHREVIENKIIPLSPEDIAPQVNRINDYSKETYKKARDLMYSKGLIPPENIFESK